MMPTVLITGGTGLIGRALSKQLLKKGYQVIIVSRQLKNRQAAVLTAEMDIAHWDIDNQLIDEDAIRQADYIVQLAGAPISAKRWNNKRKREIADSRIKSTALIVKALNEIPNQVQAVVSASAIGWYGADPIIPAPTPFVESDKADTGFLGETCAVWEAGVEPIKTMNKRLVVLRTGIVLSTEGGALAEFIKPVQWGVAAILGRGDQVISWIHMDDICRIFIEAIENPKMTGIYNAVAPAPVDNRELNIKLARMIKGKFFLPVHVPRFFLRAMLGEMSIEVLKSTTVSAEKIKKTGFQFLYPTIDSALRDLVR
jgi:uncharacterized protein (TIGR01777 family)